MILALGRSWAVLITYAIAIVGPPDGVLKAREYEFEPPVALSVIVVRLFPPAHAPMYTTMSEPAGQSVLVLYCKEKFSACPSCTGVPIALWTWPRTAEAEVKVGKRKTQRKKAHADLRRANLTNAECVVW
jgi:hypothetical protein